MRTRHWPLPLIAAVLLAAPDVAAQEREEAGAASDRAPAQAIEPYLGTWSLTTEFQGNPVRMTLEIAPLEDSVKAALRIPMRPEAQLIESVATTETGIDLAYDAEFGGASARVHIKGALEDGKLVGTFGDEGGFFSAEFTGEKTGDPAGLVSAALDAAAGAEEATEQQRRRFGGTTEARLTLDDGSIRILYPPLELHSPDGQSLLLTEEGETFTYPGGRVIKLLTDTDLHFGDTTVAAHNFSPDYPGAYGLWLEKLEDGWRLLFNQQPDVWGTMYDPDYDVAAVPLQVSELDAAATELRLELEETESGGALRIAWGDTLWSARFTTD